MCDNKFTDLGTTGSVRGCKRGGKWCMFGRWRQEANAEPSTGKLIVKNVMGCLIAMNQFPITKQRSESTFTHEGDGPWLTTVDSFGSTLDGRTEGEAHQSLEERNDRFFTGNEDFIPGDDEAYEDLEMQLEEVTRGLRPDLVAAIEDLVFNGGCRIISVHPDLIEAEDGSLARDVVIPERTKGEPPASFNRDPICPCFLHPALVFIPGFEVVEKMIKIKFEEGASSEAASMAGLITRHLENDRGNLRELLKDPNQMAHWIAIKSMVVRKFIETLKKKGK